MKKTTYTVGELSQISGATVRAIQYYDNIGLLVAKRNEYNNLRYYTESDLVKLQQILFYKRLDMSIKDIKELCLNYEAQDDLKRILNQQKEILFRKEVEIKTSIAVLEAVLSTMDTENKYVLEDVIKLTSNLNKATILDYSNVNFDDKTSDKFNERYQNHHEVVEIYYEWKMLVLEAFFLKHNSIDPKSESGYRLGEKWNSFVKTATGNDEELVEAYSNAFKQNQSWPEEDKFLIDFCDDYIDKAYEYFCEKRRFN